MSSSHTTLDAAATDRKARLAKLASLKRKQPGSDTTISSISKTQTQDLPTAEAGSVSGSQDREAAADDSQTAINEHQPRKTDVYLSGRNYDTQTQGPKLGFSNAPNSDLEDTVEHQASKLSISAAEQAARDEAEIEAGKGIDLFKLQPKKPNWDLKRDLAEKMRILDVRTQNAIARLVRERIENRKKEALSTVPVSSSSISSTRKSTTVKDQLGKDVVDGNEDDGEEVGLKGSELVEGVHLREREEEEQERRERELEEEEEEAAAAVS